MAEETKLRFLMRGRKQELFAGLIITQPKTVAEFVTEASMIERTFVVVRSTTQRVFGGPVNVPAFATEDYWKQSVK